MRAAIYIRVSTSEQAAEGYSLAAQRKSLMQWCNGRAYDVTGVYADEGISAKDIKHRPAMLQLLSDVQAGEIDVVCVWALSRLTRSVADLYSVWDLFAAHNCGLISYTEAFDTTTPTGRAMMGMLGIFAQMEREFTAERVSAAIAERAAQGKRTCNEPKIQLARGFGQLFNLKFGSIYDKIGKVFTRKPYNLTKTLDALRNTITREDRKRKNK